MKIVKILNANKNNTTFSFLRKNDLIYRKETNANTTSFLSIWICALVSILKNIFKLMHDVNDHFDFDKTYEMIMSIWYIREVIKHFSKYFKHCLKCQVNQIKRYKSFDNLQFILNSSIFSYAITIDFVLIISFFHNNLNNVMSMTCKFSKRITIVFDKNIWKMKN